MIRIGVAILYLACLTPLAFIFANPEPLLQHLLPDPALLPKTEYVHGRIERIVEEGRRDVAGTPVRYQRLEVQITDGPDAGRTIPLEFGGQLLVTAEQLFKAGDRAVLARDLNDDGTADYRIYDHDRLFQVGVILVGFLLVVMLLAGKKGVGSLLGLAVSLVMIVRFIVPAILLGVDPILVTTLGCAIILVSSTYLAHGISIQTTVALFSTLAALVLAGLFAIGAVYFAQLAGLGDEEVAQLQFGPTAVINLRGLLLSGVIIGTLGALNDLTTTQAATIFEVTHQAPTIRFWRLVRTGFLVGREHIVSLVNTLVLAYAGSSLVVLIFFVLNPSRLPYWVLFNSELVADEVLRTAAGGVGLALAVPITTLLGAFVALRADYHPAGNMAAPLHSHGHAVPLSKDEAPVRSR